MAIIDVVRRAQQASLMGPYEPYDRDELREPYESLGDMSQPYDLSRPEAVRELKLALRALGELAADRLRTSDPAIETRWLEIAVDEDVPSWDPASADELSLAVGRYRGWGWQVPGPYAVSTPVGPQPTATGLELIAGAVNELLGGSPRMVDYERWREGAFAPPSRLYGPAPEAPVVHLSYFGPGFYVAPPDTAPEIKEQIALAEQMLSDAHAGAMQSGDEQERAKLAADMLLARSIRDAWVAEAIARADVREGTTEVTRMDEVACRTLGGRWAAETATCEAPPKVAAAKPSPWPLALIGAAAVGAVLLLRHKPAERTRDYGSLRGQIVPRT